MLRGSRAPNVPLLVRNTQVNNYAQVIVGLRWIREKNKDNTYSRSIINDVKSHSELEAEIKALNTIFTTPEEEITLEDLIQSSQEERIFKQFESFEQEVSKNFSNSLKKSILEMKNYKESKSVLERNLCLNDIKVIENNLDRNILPNEFADIALGEIYNFLTKSQIDSFFEEKCFLEQQYFNFINSFYKTNSEKLDTSDISLEEKIQEFVKMKFNKMDYNIEVFEEKYLYAELYVYLRCGLIEDAVDLLENYHFFSPNFCDIVKSFLENQPKPRDFSFKPKEDLFKQTILQMVTYPFNVENTPVISTYEDVLWTKINSIINGERVDLSNFFTFAKSSRIKAILAILSKEYYSAIKLLLTGEFSAVDAFFLSKELIRKDDQAKYIFLNFVFLIIKKMSFDENKAKLIHNLSFIPPKDIAIKIVEFDSLEILALLPEEYKNEVITILRNSSNRSLLLKLYQMNNNLTEIIFLLEDSIVEELISDNFLIRTSDYIYSNVIDYIKQKNCLPESSKLHLLIGLLALKSEKSIDSLIKSSLFNESSFEYLKELNCIEKILLIACDVVIKERNHFYAKKLVELSDKLEATGFVQQSVVRRLVHIL